MTEDAKQLQALLEELIDKGIISRWYYNGTYHWEYKKETDKCQKTRHS